MIYTVTSIQRWISSYACLRSITIVYSRASEVRIDNGGKGFNISRALRMLDIPNQALGFLGGKTGERMSEELAALGIPTDFDWISGETRTNVHIVDLQNGRYIKVNQPGPQVQAIEFDRLLRKVQIKSPAG